MQLDEHLLGTQHGSTSTEGSRAPSEGHHEGQQLASRQQLHCMAGSNRGCIAAFPRGQFRAVRGQVLVLPS